MNNNTHVSSVKIITGVGIFSALAFLTTFICQVVVPIKIAGFLSIDAKDAIISMAAFIYSPIVAPIISAIVAFMEFITFSSTGIWGFLMNFVSSSVFAFVSSYIYKRAKSFNGAIIGFSISAALTTAVMVALNPIIVPLYSGATISFVLSILPTVILPFNLAKTLMNSAIAILLYKPIINAMRSVGLVKKSEHTTKFNKTTVVAIIVGVVFILFAVGGFILAQFLYNK